MKIAICVNGRAHEGGITSYINTIVDGFREFGHEVDVITVFGTFQYREVHNDFVRMSDTILSKSDIRTLIAYRISQIILLLNLWKSHLNKRYDIIYAIDISVANISTVLKYLYKMPVFLNVQSSIVADLINQGKITENSYTSDFIINQEKKAYKNVDGIIVNSSYMNTYIKRINPNCSKVTIIRNVVNDKIFFPDKKARSIEQSNLGIASDKFVILCPARLVKRKGVKYPILALLELSQKYDDLVLIYAGDGDEKNNLYNLISEYKLERSVKILGRVDSKKMSLLYNISDAVIIPSVTYKGLEEPLGITALEAMACGIPVIASRIGGLKEIIRDDYNGILILEKSPKSIADAIVKLKENPELGKKLVKNGLDTINNDYTCEKVTQKLLDIFNSPRI